MKNHEKKILSDMIWVMVILEAIADKDEIASKHVLYAKEKLHDVVEYTSKKFKEQK